MPRKSLIPKRKSLEISEKTYSDLQERSARATSYKAIENVYKKTLEAVGSKHITKSQAFGILIGLGKNCEDLYADRRKHRVLELASRIYKDAYNYSKRNKHYIAACCGKVMLALALDAKLKPEKRSDCAEEARQWFSRALEENNGKEFVIESKILKERRTGKGMTIRRSEGIVVGEILIYDTSIVSARALLEAAEVAYEEGDVNTSDSLKSRALWAAVKAYDIGYASIICKKMSRNVSFTTLAAIIDDQTIPIELREKLLPMFRDAAMSKADLRGYWGVIDPERIAKTFFRTMNTVIDSASKRRLKKELMAIKQEVIETYPYLKDYEK